MADHIPQPSSRMFRIYDQDLALLERSAGVIHEALSMSPAYMRPDVQVSIEEMKRILSDVRWDYGPYSHVERVPAGVDDGDDA